jgi:hypothetical protein
MNKKHKQICPISADQERQEKKFFWGDFLLQDSFCKLKVYLFQYRKEMPVCQSLIISA